ncbi:hypothetical protein ACR79R_21160 [Sphingobacterium spiritivorum]|uniref:hypothetical protein n=2 Tax=Sphingobacterium spiritivorum TaxID=258 RepID=UPI003DA3218D
MAVLTRHKLQPRRHALCWEYSGHRTESSRDLTDTEAMKIIDDLEKQTIKMKRKLISLCYDILWVTTSGKADVARLDSWCRTYGKFKKPLNSLVASELQVLITQFESMNTKILSS